MDESAAVVLVSRDLSNDARGWVLCAASGLACCIGAAVIYVDELVRLFPGQKNFRIQDSNAFLACSLSLSFGVMLFSSLYSMLPEAKENLRESSFNDQQGGLILMACFIGGFLGIQAFTRLLHQFIPSHVVECDHTHDEGVTDDGKSCQHGRAHSRTSRSKRRRSTTPIIRAPVPRYHHHEAANGDTESTPLLDGESRVHRGIYERQASARGDEIAYRPNSPLLASRQRVTTGSSAAVQGPASRRQSLVDVQRRIMSFVRDSKCDCGESNSCYGYTDPCGQECFKHLGSRTSPIRSRTGTMIRTTTGPFYSSNSGSVFHSGGSHRHRSDAVSPSYRTSRAASRDVLDTSHSLEDEEMHECDDAETTNGGEDECSNESDLEAQQHHHHVPENAFLSIGLQTSVAITLHKFPEGFVTYATNHANPNLGLNVFLALFVHNLCEGFTMALPLYMALNSRWKALSWAALLGGLSQPAGALIAYAVLEASKNSHMAPNAVAYACLFAVTAGMMVSVALQLFVESLSLNHDRNLCIFFAFLGMVLLGLSNALFAEH